MSDKEAMQGQDPFAGITRAIAEGGNADTGDKAAFKSKATSKCAGDWVDVVPDDAPSPRSSHNTHGRPSQVWSYWDCAGRLIHYVCRFDKADGAKEIIPLTLWREAGRLSWRWKAAPVPRPLYGLDRLAAMPAAPVLLVEGEKAAEAGAALFPDFAVMTWSGGSKAAGKADWSPMAGRRVVILPDADAVGREAAEAVRKLALAAGAEGVAVVPLPAHLPQGWDCADVFPVEFDRLDLAAVVTDALESASAGKLELPHGYSMEPEGLFWQEAGKDGEAGRMVLLSDAFEVLGEARDAGGGDWSLIIRFHDRDGIRKTKIIKRSQVASEAGAVRSELAGDGLFIDPARGKTERFARFLMAVKHSRRLTLAERTGWIDAGRFVLPSGVIAGPDAEPVLFDGAASALHYRQKGSLGGWQNSLGQWAVGNRNLTFAIALAFVGPIMGWLGLEGGGFHFRGASSTGKTSLAWAAGSVWGGGGPLGFGASWRATGNALEGVAYGHSETLLILDELALVDPQEAGAAAYSLAAGQGKARARQDGALRKRSEWRVMILSTGEIGLADHMRAAKRAERTMTGQELRLLDMAADAGAGYGAWEALHGMASPAAFSDAIKTASAAHYGFAGPAFVRGLVGDLAHWRKEVERLAAGFVAMAKQEDDSGQIHRAALRFGAVAAAGEVAARLGVVPWPAGTAKAAALACFNQWAIGFGRKGMREDRQVLVTVRNAIQQNLARFGTVRDRLDDDEGAASARAGEARSLSSLGFVHDIQPAKTCYLFHDAGWAEILKGFDLKAAAEALTKAGYLVTGDGGRPKRKIGTGPNRNQRFFTVRAAILEYDEYEIEGIGEGIGIERGGAQSATVMKPPPGW
ncbi:DUF927 domain-containing protein [Novosphingobium umbonatum]|uniref:DUF927 domain-containing protein n=1 Tax=Novosphingobium umbonatum TaxID=1908524 RepID=A0A3S2Y7A5_9SPHN|nr:DUF927 domain-containing protein [Novosphingobium umbonatum]RVU05121.1 DUF927 domain-containing protein [Novosphingobium umbonatum]